MLTNTFTPSAESNASQTVKDVFVALSTKPGASTEVTRDSAITLATLQEASKRFKVPLAKEPMPWMICAMTTAALPDRMVGDNTDQGVVLQNPCLVKMVQLGRRSKI